MMYWRKVMKKTSQLSKDRTRKGLIKLGRANERTQSSFDGLYLEPGSVKRYTIGG